MGGAAQIPIDRIWDWSDRYDAPGWFVDALITLDSNWIRTNGQ